MAIKKRIDEDIQLSKLMFDLAAKHPKQEVMNQNLSITTFKSFAKGTEYLI
jgi:aromatic-L-amino-acid decarboxylase